VALVVEATLQLVRPAVLDAVRQRTLRGTSEDADFITHQPINFDPASGLPLLVQDPEAFWRIAPERHGTFFLTDDVRTNALGLRGPELAPHAGAGELRLLFLGDSVTFGMRVAESERFSDRLAGSLRAELPGLRVTPVNAGVIGYAASQVLVRLPGWLEATRPDVVFLAVGVNDSLLLPASDAEFRRLTTASGERLRRALRRSQLVCLAEAGLAWLRREADALGGGPRRPVVRWLHYPRLPPGGARVPRTSEDEYLAVLDRIQELCRARGVPLVLVTEYASPAVPSTRMPDEAYFARLAALAGRLRAHAASRGLPLADARAALEGSGLAPAELLLDFCHPSPAGHALVAAELQRALEAAGLLAAWRERAAAR
jgi:lysophospholipase L1-like esterase